jgi:type II secretory pathway pseudopilin PulG
MMTAMKDIRRRVSEGFTLVELLVYSVLMILVIGLAATLFIRLITEQKDITAMAEAENSMQLLYKQLETDIRNADWAEIDGSGDLLVLRTGISTSVTSTSVMCVGYYYDDVDSTMRRLQTTQSAPTKSALDAATKSSRRTIASTWILNMNDVDRIGSTAVFGPRDAPFGEFETIEISLRANTSSNRKPIEFVKSVSLRPQSGMGTGCR